jgi:hypothetical protein
MIGILRCQRVIVACGVPSGECFVGGGPSATVVGGANLTPGGDSTVTMITTSACDIGHQNGDTSLVTILSISPLSPSVQSDEKLYLSVINSTKVQPR